MQTGQTQHTYLFAIEMHHRLQRKHILGIVTNLHHPWGTRNTWGSYCNEQGPRAKRMASTLFSKTTILKKGHSVHPGIQRIQGLRRLLKVVVSRHQCSTAIFHSYPQTTNNTPQLEFPEGRNRALLKDPRVQLRG